MGPYLETEGIHSTFIVLHCIVLIQTALMLTGGHISFYLHSSHQLELAVSSTSPHSSSSVVKSFPMRQESIFFYATALHCGIILLSSAMPGALPENGTEIDRLALLAFRDQIIDSPLGALSTWKDNYMADFCQWEGITCSNHSRRVTVLNLQSRRFVGSLSPHLQNLSFLQQLNLGDNHLQGTIPPELGNLINLRILNLTTNSFGGEIPSNISSCKQLEYLDLSNNGLVGEVPTDLTSLPKLDTLYLLVNNLTGRIPSSIGNLSSLTILAMGRNNLQGSIPDSIGAITGLNFLQIAENQLSGMIPQSLYNLSSLTFVTVAANQLHGSLPPTLGLTLQKLDTLYVGGNQLTGPIPLSISNASGLINLDFAENNFTGSIPTDLGKLGGLQWLNFEGNRLGTGGSANDLKFLTSLSNCTNLEVLDVDNNRLGGMILPSTIANLSLQLSMLIMSSNQIYGMIPDSIGNLSSLTVVRLENNLLTGRVPHSIGRLHNLQLLSLSQNRLSGAIPTTLGNLTQLSDLHLQKNDIQGSIPITLRNCRKLQLLDFSHNKLNGAIPEAVITIPSLSVFLSLAHNSLVGPLPSGIGNLKNLGELDISENRLSGEIPPEIGNCESIEYLHMQANLLIGSLPPTFSNLKGMQYLDLSHNNLSGQVPDFLQSLHSLWYLNLSFNDFEGLVPKGGVFMNASAISVEGNTRLCGGPPAFYLPSCIVQNSKKSGAMQILVPIICAVSGLSLLLCVFTALYCLRNRKKFPPETSSLHSHSMVISYSDLVKATNGFSSSNLIGKGGFGTVYRGTLDSKGEVAVKVLNLQNRGASKSFMAECETLRHVRHRNLVKIMTLCSSIDSIGNEFKALVYEFMPNGSLDEWLHPDLEKQHHYSKVLNTFQRLSICMDIAAALDYLHHQCQRSIVHCDLKPRNVLLDEDMNAHVGDFGLAKISLGDINSQFQTSSTGIKGSIGYIPPEYGVGGEVSTQGDVYSYGILLLEMFTGKRPTDDDIFNNNGSGSLHEFVKMAYPDRIMEIIDPRLMLSQELAEGEMITGKNNEMMMMNRELILERLILVMGIGLCCSATSPRERMQMREVATKLHAIKMSLLGEKNY